MMVYSSKNRKRTGFTLVELIVVIAIIVILMALSVGVISRVWASVDESSTKTEIGKLAEACEAFKTTFGRYPPSRIILAEPTGGPNSYAGMIAGLQGPAMAELAKQSVDYLSAIFPGLQFTVPINWRNSASALTNYYVLEGHECLVYFLGGINVNGSLIGFNTDKTNPTLPTTTGRLGPFYTFTAERLKVFTINPGSGGQFNSYMDRWGTPYAYFASRQPGNTMNNYYHPACPFFTANSLTLGDQAILSDNYYLCDFYNPPLINSTNNRGGLFCPYYQSRGDVALPGTGGTNWPPAMTATTNVVYFKPDRFQIISAGRDKSFGSGGHYFPKDAENSSFNYANGILQTGNTGHEIFKKANFDNLTNLSDTSLMVPK